MSLYSDMISVGHDACRCPLGWGGLHCDQSTSCKNFCFNHATCLLSSQNDAMPSCLCARGFTGPRCQDRVDQIAYSDHSTSASDNLPNSKFWLINAVFCFVNARTVWRATWALRLTCFKNLTCCLVSNWILCRDSIYIWHCNPVPGSSCADWELLFSVNLVLKMRVWSNE